MPTAELADAWWPKGCLGRGGGLKPRVCASTGFSSVGGVASGPRQAWYSFKLC